MTNQNSIQEGIKCRLKAENSCYYSVQTLSSSRLLSKNLKIEILPVMIYGCEAWSLIFRLKRDENKEWRRLRNEELHHLYRSPNSQGDYI